jgi:glycosyltransferase involved in cell wall biosynthesis
MEIISRIKSRKIHDQKKTGFHMQLSIVIPVYNEADNLLLLHKTIREALENLEDLQWEIVFVDDGSSDNSIKVLEELAYDVGNICLVELRRNFGQTAAIAAGLDYAQGDIIILMDADLQNDPADIPMMLEKINQGYDVVSGWRVNRQDTFLTRILPSRIANWLISLVTGVHLHDYGCTLKAYRKEVIKGFRLYGEMHRFIPAYAYSVGAKMIEVPVHHHARKYGKTKYGLTRTFKVFLDLFTVKYLLSFANKPIYLFGGAGTILILTGGVTLGFLLIRRIMFGISVVRSPFFSVGTMILIMGFQSILMGLIAELLARTYHESQQKPIYTVRKAIQNKKEIVKT